jgi:hypothetical protein
MGEPVTLVVRVPQAVQIRTANIPGPPGPPGPPGASATIDPIVTGETVIEGAPVVVRRSDRKLVNGRADTYTLSFVVGLAGAATASGFAVSPVRGEVTLADWTAITGTPTLSVGIPYFLALSGGLTTTPDRTSGHALTQVGIATAPDTLFVNPSPPVLL